MERHLNLVTSDFEEYEKRILPKFPFCYLIFKTKQDSNGHVYEIKDISQSGMQINLKNGEFLYKEGDQVGGTIHWGEYSLDILGDVRWARDNRAGVEFAHNSSLRTEVDNFLDLKKIAKFLKPVHDLNFGEEFPPRLQYWLRSDGPVELFVWQHDGGQLSHFQIVIMENFIEWEDTKGVKTARVMSKRDIATPLVNEDEYIFSFDKAIDHTKINKAKTLLESVERGLLPEDVREFIFLKLGK